MDRLKRFQGVEFVTEIQRKDGSIHQFMSYVAAAKEGVGFTCKLISPDLARPFLDLGDGGDGGIILCADQYDSYSLIKCEILLNAITSSGFFILPFYGTMSEANNLDKILHGRATKNMNCPFGG